MRRALVLLCVFTTPAFADFKRLHAERALATSFLESSWNKYQENYHPTYVLDDDPKTAWVEGVAGDGVGESLTVKLSALRQARALRLVVTPGFQKSKGLFAANGTPTRLDLVVRDVGGKVTAKQSLELEAVWGSQTFDVALDGGLSEVTLSLGAVRPGATYQDTCLSDVQFFVDSDVPYDARVETAKRDAMRAWKKERLETAKYFAALPTTYPFASTQFAVSSQSEKVVSLRWAKLDWDTMKHTPNPKFQELSTQLEHGTVPGDFNEADSADLREVYRLTHTRADAGWFTAASKRPPKTPDGFSSYESGSVVSETLPSLTPFMRVADFSLFEARVRGVQFPAMRPEQAETVVRSASNVLLLEGTATAPTRLFLVFRKLDYGRTIDETITSALLTYRDGLLSRVALFSVTSQAGVDPSKNEEGAAPAVFQIPEASRFAYATSAATWTLEALDGKITALNERALSDSHLEAWAASLEEGTSVFVRRYKAKARATK